MDVMLSAYTVRKLIEAQTKIPQDLARSSVSVHRYPLHDDRLVPDLMNWEQLDRWYNLDTNDERPMAMIELCNLLIHSWIFAPSIDPDTGLTGLFFNSDRTRHERLFFIDIAVLTRAFRSFGAAEVTNLDMERGTDGQWVVRDAGGK